MENRGSWKKDFFPLGIILAVGKSITRYIVADKKGSMTLTAVDADAKVEYKPKVALTLVPRQFPLIIDYNGAEYTFTVNGDKIELAKFSTDADEKEKKGE